MSQNDVKKFAQCLNELLKTLLECSTIQKISEETVRVINDHLFYDAIVLHIFNQDEKLQLRANFGIKLLDEIEQIDQFNNNFILENFTEQKMYIFHDWPKKPEYNQFFPELGEFQSLAVTPLFYENYILGFLSVGYLKQQKFTHDEMILFNSIGISLGNILGNLVHQSNFKKRVDDLKEIIKRVRHDFANDIQSIALALELLQSCELDDDQKKYTRILNNAKDSSIEKITELKRLKTQHEEDVTIDIGLPLKE